MSALIRPHLLSQGYLDMVLSSIYGICLIVHQGLNGFCGAVILSCTFSKNTWSPWEILRVNRLVGLVCFAYNFATGYRWYLQIGGDIYAETPTIFSGQQE